MSGTRKALDHLLDGVGTKVAFAAQGLSHAIVALVDVLAGHDDRITELEEKCARLERMMPGRLIPAAEYDDPDKDRAAGDSSQNTPAAPTRPASPSPATPLPGQTTIDDHLPRTTNADKVIQALRDLGGEASKVAIANHTSIPSGSIAGAIDVAIKRNAIVDTGRTEPRRGRSSPIYALIGDGTSRPDPTPHVVSPRVRRELERAARRAAGQDLPPARDQQEAKMSNLRRALADGPRDAHQLARILGVPVRDAAALMVAGHRDRQIVVEQGVARLL